MEEAAGHAERAEGALKGAAKAGDKKKKGGGFAIGGVKTKALTLFTRQLSTLQDAGLPILRSLNILEEQQKPGAMKNVLRTVTDEFIIGVEHAVGA